MPCGSGADEAPTAARKGATDAPADALLRTAGTLIAPPEMMAPANMLHHPAITHTTRRGCNVHTIEQDRRGRTEVLGEWPASMWAALQEKFGPDAQELALRAGTGIRQLMQSGSDMNQAVYIANQGSLASMDLGVEQLSATARRLEAEVIEELEARRGRPPEARSASCSQNGDLPATSRTPPRQCRVPPRQPDKAPANQQHVSV